MPRDALDRIIADVERIGAVEEARRALVEARFLLLSSDGPLLERSEQAVAVLERGIRDAEYALNITEEPGE